jgi:hypothetical protein
MSGRERLIAYLHRNWGCRGGAETDPSVEYRGVADGLIEAMADHLHATRGCRASCRKGLSDDGHPDHRSAWLDDAERLFACPEPAEVMDEQSIWAWQCEHCHKWMHPDIQPTAVLVKEPDVDIRMVTHVEATYVTRKMAICFDCVQNMRTTWG